MLNIIKDRYIQCLFKKIINNITKYLKFIILGNKWLSYVKVNDKIIIEFY
jgi:hypothetical protein